MRWFVLWLFADLIFRLNNFSETIGFLLSLALSVSISPEAGITERKLRTRGGAGGEVPTTPSPFGATAWLARKTRNRLEVH
jgi:hypothetical protein